LRHWLRPKVFWAGAITLAVAALAIVVGSGAAAGTASAGAKPAVPPGTAYSRITGRPILGSSPAGISNSAAAPTPTPPRKQQIRVLKRVLHVMQKNYAKYANETPGPQDIMDYGIGSLWLKGIDGAGTTVAVIEGWKDSHIAAQVAGFDKQFGLPNPKIKTIYPAGPLPKKCPAGMVKLGSYGSCSAWQGELTLDVISAHLIAPYAKIIISATPADSEINADAAQQVAPPEMMKALEVISAQHLANSISISDGTGETTYSNGREEILAQNPGELAAAAAGIPVLNATGDCGVVQNLAVANGQCEDVSSGPDTATWDDSPWNTGVGGSVPNVNTTNGKRLGPDPLWHVPAPDAEFSEGAGFSSVFSRPTYQDGVAHITGSPMRSVPDIVMDAQDGTSEAAPLLNGVMALATQMNHGNVGPINPALYRVLGPAGAKDGISDVVKGNESAETPTGKVTVPGFVATKGFDVASGWGTVFAPRFVPALAAATKASGDEASYRHKARAQLVALEHSLQVSPTRVGSHGRCYLQADGFLPKYPVVLSIDGHNVATVKANSLGVVTYMVEPSMLGLGSGTHRASLSSMLITKSGQFRVS
jgi:subtilase family serine protease